MAWRESERRVKVKAGTLCSLFEKAISSEAEKWREILKRILDVILFLGERGLAFRGTSEKIGDINNGNFLGIIELLSHYNLKLQEHINKVKEAQEKEERLGVHYLSKESQNEFISTCAELVRKAVLEEREKAKYFSIMLDATPDAAHVEQTTFILRYVLKETGSYMIHERFLKYVDLNEKTGIEIANMILETLQDQEIKFSDCRGQGYDNGSNISGKYNGAQSHLLRQNKLCVFSPCACHSLNLVGQDSAEICAEAVTFFGVVQTVYNLFSSSPKRWEILTSKIEFPYMGCPVHAGQTELLASAHLLPTYLGSLKLWKHS